MIGFWTGDMAGVLLFLPMIAMLFISDLRQNLIRKLVSAFSSVGPFVALIGFPAIVITGIYLSTTQYSGHFIVTVFVFIPIAIAGALHGITGSVLVSFVSSLLLATGFAFFHVWDIPSVGAQVFLIAMCSIGLVIGSLSDRSLANQKNMEVSEERFKHFVASSSDWYWEMGEDLRFSYISPDHLSVTGYDPKKFILKERTELSSKLIDDNNWQAHLEDLNNHRPFRNFEYEFLKADGTPIHVRIQGAPIFNSEGKFCGYRGTANDITELFNSQSAHEHEVNLRHKLLEVSEVGFWYVDLNGKTLDVNPAMCKMLGRPYNDIVGKRTIDLFNSKDEAFLQKQYLQRRKGLKATYEFVFVRPDGTAVTCLNNATPVMGEDGKPIGSVGMWTDISAQKEAQHELSRMGRLAAINEMGSSILHEINTPIQTASLTAYLGLMDCKNKTATVEGLAENLENIRDALDRVAQVEARIRRFMSGEKSQLIETDINQSIKMAAELMDSELRSHQTSIKLDLNHNLPKGMVDAVELEQVLINLYKNASEAMVDIAPENKEICVSSAVEEGQKIIITVSDIGSGVCDDLKEHIFDSFKTSKSGGTGMGLSLCRNIIEGFGGSIDVECDDGAGCSFVLLLPLAKDIA